MVDKNLECKIFKELRKYIAKNWENLNIPISILCMLGAVSEGYQDECEDVLEMFEQINDGNYGKVIACSDLALEKMLPEERGQALIDTISDDQN